MDADLVVQLFHSMLIFIRMASIYKQISSLSLGQLDKLYSIKTDTIKVVFIVGFIKQLIQLRSPQYSAVVQDCIIQYLSQLLNRVEERGDI